MKPFLIRASISACLLSLFPALQCAGYELRTHAALTFEAYNRSNLVQNPKILENLGLTADKARELGSIYYDIQGNSSRTRSINNFEKDRMPQAAADFPISIPGYITRGAIREDDITTFGCLVGNAFNATKLVDYFDLTECNPRDDPYGDIERVLNHFYDPIYNRGLTVSGIPPIVPSINGVAAPNWALGTVDAFAFRPQPNTSRRNHFSVIDARQAMLAALSGAAPGSNTPLNETERNTWWATTFRSLGDMLHLLQDMSQPQHTKNEPHPSSYLEKYTDQRTRQLAVITPNGLTVPLPPLEFGSYPKPAFPRFSDYWSTAPVDSVVVGRGLADYAHRGFLTAKNNIVPAKKMADYPFPSPRIESYTVEAEPVELPDEQDPTRTKTYQVTYLRGDVPDALAGGSNNIRMATTSALSKFTKDKVNQVNRFIYDDQTSLLHPRAIGYSAGLIDYFFRGKIDFVTDDAMPGRYKIKNLGEERMTGRFALYYDDTDGIRRPTPNVWMLDIPAQGESESLTVQPNTDTDMPPESLDGYVLVFNGDMGEEKQAPGSVGAVTGKVIEDPLEIKIKRVYYYSDFSNPVLNGFDATLEVKPDMVEAVRQGRDNMRVVFKSARGEETFSCLNFAQFGLGEVNQYCYNFRDPSININFDFEDKTNPNDLFPPSYLMPHFYYNSYGVGDHAAEITVYVGDARLFAFKFEPETVADYSPVTFSKKFHVNTKEQVNVPPGERL